MQHAPVQQVPTSQFDLSNFHKTSFKMGMLVPHFDLEVLPGDRLSLSVDALYRMPNLYAPIMETLEVHNAFFYVRYSTLYDRWKSVIKPNWSTLEDETVPYIDVNFTNMLTNEDVWMNSIISYMGFPVPTITGELTTDPYITRINALPIAAYWKIWNDYYRDAIMQPEWGYADPFDVQDEQPLIRDLGTTSDWSSNFREYQSIFLADFDITTVNNPVNDWVYLQPMYRNWNYDYFTAAKYEPQYSEAILLPTFDLTRDHTGESQWIRDADNEIVQGGRQGLQKGLSPDSYLERDAAGTPIKTWLDTSETAGTIAQLRFAEQMQTFLEKINRIGDRYRSHVRTFYGVDPGGEGYSTYIGSHTSIMAISDVWQQDSQRGGDQSQQIGEGLGAYAGKGIGNSTTQSFQFQAPDFGHIIGIVNIQPQSSYHQGVHKKWTRETWEDYAMAQFANIGDQEIIEKELVLRYDLGWNHPNQLDTWGYVPRFSEWKYNFNRTSGELRKYYTQFHLTRSFQRISTTPALSPQFLVAWNQNMSTDGTDILPTNVGAIDAKRIMEVASGYDDVYAWIWTQCLVIRALPKYGIPGHHMA